MKKCQNVKHEICIIGTGLFGSIIGRHLQGEGREVYYLDSEERGAASKAAACLMKPSWISGLGKELCDTALETLNNMFTIHTLEFETSKLIKTKVKWINPREIMVDADYKFPVTSIQRKDNWWVINGEVECRYLIMAAGIWCNSLLIGIPGATLVEGLSPRTGTAFTVGGTTFPRISVWRPYRQLTAFNIRPMQVWVGDSEGYKSYDESKLIKSQNRCAEFIARNPSDLLAITGHRPYVPAAKPCYFEEHAPNLWVVTGGAKNGTIAAGWAAWKMGEVFNDL